MKRTAVIAIGGNSLITDKEHQTVPDQYLAAAETCRHVAPLLAQTPELSAIEVVVDPYPRPERRPYEVRMYQLIQEHKPLILDVNFPDAAEAEALLAELSQRGLCFNARFDDASFAALPPDYPGRQVWVLA